MVTVCLLEGGYTESKVFKYFMIQRVPDLLEAVLNDNNINSLIFKTLVTS